VRRPTWTTIYATTSGTAGVVTDGRMIGLPATTGTHENPTTV
jgi:hypothetical protein